MKQNIKIKFNLDITVFVLASIWGLYWMFYWLFYTGYRTPDLVYYGKYWFAQVPILLLFISLYLISIFIKNRINSLVLVKKDSLDLEVSILQLLQLINIIKYLRFVCLGLAILAALIGFFFLSVAYYDFRFKVSDFNTTRMNLSTVKYMLGLFFVTTVPLLQYRAVADAITELFNLSIPLKERFERFKK